MTRALPTGTVTFLFTDIEASTLLLTRLGAAYAAVLARHHAILRAAIAASGGIEVSTEGDAFFVAFSEAGAAVTAAIDAQRRLAGEAWPDGEHVLVRMGLHTGIGEVLDDTYVGLDVHRASRIASAGHGGQVLLSESTRALAGAAIAANGSLRDLGEVRLKDLPAPERVFQLVADGLRDAFPPLRTSDARRGNLPTPVTSFVGRETEIAAVSALLSRSRLVTLTGPGGTGKTRLSIAVAGRVGERYANGAWFVPLEAVRDPDLVLPEIGRVLGVRERQDRSPEQMLVEHFADRSPLLVLDNLEQVVAVAPRLGQLLVQAPQVSILASSREVLRLSGEQEYPVPALPDDPAVELFIARARQVRPDFEPSPEDLEIARRICERLDGLPLAIELAAARIRVLSVAQIADRLDDRLKLLTSGGQDRPDRQRTLRGAIEWSHELLGPQEQRFFRGLGVFAGQPDMDAIEAVVDPDGAVDALELVTSLTEKSLLRAVPAAGQVRFAMLESIRAYAAERATAAAELDALRERHARFYADEAERIEPELGGRQPERFLQRLEADNDEIRAAMAWAMANDRPDIGLRIGAAIWRFWQHRWHLSEGRSRLTELLAHPRAQADTHERARGLTALGGVTYWQGDVEAAHAAYQEALAVNERLHDEDGTADALYNLAFTTSIKQDLDSADALQAQAYEVFARVGNETGMTLVREARAVFAQRRGDHAAAEELIVETIAAHRKSGAQFKLSDALTFAGVVALARGDPDSAAERVAEGIHIARRIGDHSTQAIGLQMASLVALRRNDAPEAALLAGAYAVLRDAGDPFLSPTETVGMPDPEREARTVLDAATFEEAFEEGRRLSLEQGLDRALVSLDPARPD